MPDNERTEFDISPAQFIKTYLKEIVAQNLENSLFMIDGSPIFSEPLVGFADGDDPLFYQYKEKIIGPFHFTPRELLEKYLPYSGGSTYTDTKKISVICWALPINEKTRQSNAPRETWPSIKWAHTRYYGEQFNDNIRQLVVALLTRLGYLAVAPILSPLWKWLHNYPGGPVSRWSERHALYAAGMGTFGLSDGFITEKGMAMRCGSVVVNLDLPVTPRPYTNHTDNCPFFKDKSCGVCINRCPAGAITENGHNRHICAIYMRDHIGHVKERYNVEIAGCGLCQTNVPCESGIPASAPGYRKIRSRP
jgi:epoxyqueuosine reductase